MSEQIEETHPSTKEVRTASWARRLTAYTRFIVAVPVIGLFTGSLVLVVVATLDAITIVTHMFRSEDGVKEVLIGFIELADIYLLAIVLYIIALGLFELFIDDKLPLPQWLEIHNLEDLKEKLVAVVAVVLGVLFLGKVLDAKESIDVLFMGGGIAAVIIALGYFTGRVILHKKQ